MFKGLIPALVTPFDERGKVDLTAAEIVVAHVISAGVDGIAALGSTGEFSHMDARERMNLAEALTEMIAGRTPLIVGVGSSGTRESIALAEHAQRTGASAVIAVSPFYWKVGEEALFRHFMAIAEVISIPVILYNFPALTGVDLPPTLIRRLAESHPNIAGLKDSVTEHSHTLAVLREVKPARPDFSVLVGSENDILPSMLAGGDGAVCGLANVTPELFVRLVRAVQNNDLSRAAELHRRILILMELYDLSDPGLAALKEAMKMLGVPIHPAVRGPALPVPPGSRSTIARVLERAGLLQSGS